MSDISTLSSGSNPSADRSTINNNTQYLQENFFSTSRPASPRSGQIICFDNGAGTYSVEIYLSGAWKVLFANAATAGGGLLPLSGGTMTGAIAMGSTKITGLANGTASGDAVNKGQVDARTLVATIAIGTLSASDNKYLLIVPTGTTIVDVAIVSELAVASSGVNLWTFQVRNLTAAVDLRSAVKSTNGAAITADAAYALGLDQNLSPAANDVLQLQMTRTGAPNNLQELLAVVRYKIAT